MTNPKFLLTLLAAFSFSTLSYGQFLNPNFATSGYTQDVSSFGNGIKMVVQPDDKILVANQRKSYYANTNDPDKYYLYCNRYNSDGSLDNTFGTAGIARISHYDESEVLNMDIQPDGKILLGGKSKYCGNIACGWTNLVIGRLNTDGSVDMTFGSNGTINAEDILGPMYLSSSVGTLLTLSSGKTLISGVCAISTDGTTANFVYHSYVARLNDDGSLDTSFGGHTSGIVYTDQFSITVSNDMILADDGSIFWLTKNGYESVVVKLMSDGTVETNYGTGGAQMIDLGTFSNSFVSMDLRNDNKLVLGGYIYENNQYSSIMTVLNSNGSMFSQVTQCFIDVPMNNGKINTIKSISGNRVLIAGTLICDTTSFNNPARLGFVGLLNEDGTYDTSFSNDGIITFNLAAQGNWNRTFIEDMEVLSNGDILCTGGRFATPGSVKSQVLLFSLNSDGIIVNSSSIEDLDQVAQVQVYPNPIEESSILRFTSVTDEKLKIDLYDLSGRLILNYFDDVPAIGENEINLQSDKQLDAGNYMIHLTSKSGSKTISVRF